MIEIYSDGSSSGRDRCRAYNVDGNRVWMGPGGYGWVLVHNGIIVDAGYGGAPVTTNNLMEMTAAIEGLKAIGVSGRWKPGVPVVLISDSEYTLNIACGRYQPTKNKEMALELRRLFQSLNATKRWVRGHQYKARIDWTQQPRDVLLNHRCDQLAAMGRALHTKE